MYAFSLTEKSGNQYSKRPLIFITDTNDACVSLTKLKIYLLLITLIYHEVVFFFYTEVLLLEYLLVF